MGGRHRGHAQAAGVPPPCHPGPFNAWPAGQRRRIVNTSDQEIRLVSALSMTPVRVRDADGSPLPVPWEAP